MPEIATHLYRRPYTTGTITYSVRWIGDDGKYHRLSFGSCGEEEALRRKADFDATLARGTSPDEIRLSDLIANGIRADRVPYRELLIARKQESVLPRESQALALRSAEALKQALRDVKKLRAIKPVRSNNETLVSIISDAHAGKKIKGGAIYNLEIACNNIAEVGLKSAHILKNHVAGKVDEIVLALAGDIIDGWGIYPGQSFSTDCPVPEQVFEATCAIRVALGHLREAAPNAPIRVVCVKGNHGRVHKDAHPDTNWDMSVYYSLLLMLGQEEDLGISVEFPTDSDFINFDIKGHRVHMRHKAPSQAETASGRAKFAGWLNRHEFDLMICADLHHIGLTEIDGKIIVRNSAPFPADDDLPERMGVDSRASQWVFGVSKHRIPTFMYPIFFEER